MGTYILERTRYVHVHVYELPIHTPYIHRSMKYEYMYITQHVQHCQRTGRPLGIWEFLIAPGDHGMEGQTRDKPYCPPTEPRSIPTVHTGWIHRHGHFIKLKLSSYVTHFLSIPPEILTDTMLPVLNIELKESVATAVCNDLATHKYKYQNCACVVASLTLRFSKVWAVHVHVHAQSIADNAISTVSDVTAHAQFRYSCILMSCKIIINRCTCYTMS